MDFDLVVEKREEPDMEFNLRQDVGDVSEEVVALHVQEDRYVTFVPHHLVDFLDF